MSYPPWRDNGPNRPYGGDRGAGQRDRDTRAPVGDPSVPRRDPRDGTGPGTGAGPTGPRRTVAGPGTGAGPGSAWGDQLRPAPRFPGEDSTRKRPATKRRRRRRRGPLSRIGQGALRGGLGVCVIIASAALGAAATIATRSQPGLALGLFVLAGTVTAALTVEPRAGRLIFPVPALSYLVAALVAGAMYNRSADNTELAVGAAQWIANGFFVMVLATLLAIALTTVRWFLWRRSGRVPLAADWPAEARTGGPPQPGPPGAVGRGEPRSPAGRPPQGPPPQSPTGMGPAGMGPAGMGPAGMGPAGMGPAGTWGRDQRPGPGWPERPPQGPGRTSPQQPWVLAAAAQGLTASPAGHNAAPGA